MKKLILLLILFVPVLLLGQKSKIEIKGEQYYKDFSYPEAIDCFLKAKELTVEGLRELSISYKNIADYKQAVATYSRFIQSDQVISEDFFNYAFLLKMNCAYDEANSWMKKFIAVCPKDLRSQSFLKSQPVFSRLMKDQGKFQIKNLAINTSDIDFAPCFYKSYLIFSSSRAPDAYTKRLYNWNNKPFLNLFQAQILGDQLVNPQLFQKTFSNKWHQGAVCFCNDGSTIAFTRDNYQSKSIDGTVKLQIFFSFYSGKNWSELVPFIWNSPEYSIGHPSLSEDGNTMYFASDMPGGYGGVDIYRVRKYLNGEWGKPENLGKTINTEGNEMFPFFEEKSQTLFFASDGLCGLGGLDLFYSRKTDNGFMVSTNLGFPINSSYDDFSLIIDKQCKNGYFSSNRLGGKGDDDLYSFRVLKPFFGTKIIAGNAKTKYGMLLPSTAISVCDPKGDLFGSDTTATDGFFTFEVPENNLYDLQGKKPGYSVGKNSADTHLPEDTVYADLILNSLTKKVVGTARDFIGRPLTNVVVSLSDNNRKPYLTSFDGRYVFDNVSPDKLFTLVGKKPTYISGKNAVDTHTPKEIIVADLVLQDIQVDSLIDLDPIHFDLDKWNIRPDAAKILDRVVEIMNENPTMVVELSSYTDSRASFEYNKVLSEKRAQSTAAYIKRRITNPERINGHGYGETHLLNDCQCEGDIKTDCTEAEHQLNRRTEFRIVRM
jgi:outer membrane protein OmpA-like peptidoglycan-associated protein